MPASAYLTSRAYRGLRPHCWPLRVCRTRLHFADRFRAGAGRRSGSGWRQGRVRWGRPLLSRPRGAVGSGSAAVESAAVSAVALTCGLMCVGGFVGVIRVPLCARVSSVCPVCVPAPPGIFLPACTARVSCVRPVCQKSHTDTHSHSHKHFTHPVCVDRRRVFCASTQFLDDGLH